MIKAIINAPSTVKAGDSVTLDGSRSKGHGLRYSWSQTGGTRIQGYRGQGTPQLVFTAPDNTVNGQSVDHTLTFGLIVTDDRGFSNAMAAQILVKASITMPPPPPPPTNVPTVDVVNHSHESDATVQQWIAAVQQQCDNDVVKYWGTVKINFIGQDNPGDGNWHAGFFDNAEQAGILGWHDYSPTGGPLIKIFTTEAEKFGEVPSITFSHEICETIADPDANIQVRGISPDGRDCYYYQEVCDPVEGNAYRIADVSVSDFATPNWFKQNSQEPYDQLGATSKPFDIIKNGYMEISYDGNNWTEIFESKVVKDNNGVILGRIVEDTDLIKKIKKHRKGDSRWAKYHTAKEDRLLSTYETK